MWVASPQEISQVSPDFLIQQRLSPKRGDVTDSASTRPGTLRELRWVKALSTSPSPGLC